MIILTLRYVNLVKESTEFKYPEPNISWNEDKIKAA